MSSKGEFRVWTGEVEPGFQEVLCAVTPRVQLSAVKDKLPAEGDRGLVWNSTTAHGAEWLC